MGLLCSLSLLLCYAEGCSAAEKYANQTPPNHVILMLESEGIKRFQSRVKENKQAIVFCISKQPCLDHNPSGKAYQTSKYLPSSIFLLFPQSSRFLSKSKKGAFFWKSLKERFTEHRQRWSFNYEGYPTRI